MSYFKKKTEEKNNQNAYRTEDFAGSLHNGVLKCNKSNFSFCSCKSDRLDWNEPEVFPTIINHATRRLLAHTNISIRHITC